MPPGPPGLTLTGPRKSPTGKCREGNVGCKIPAPVVMCRIQEEGLQTETLDK